MYTVLSPFLKSQLRISQEYVLQSSEVRSRESNWVQSCGIGRRANALARPHTSIANPTITKLPKTYFQASHGTILSCPVTAATSYLPHPN